MTQALNIHTKIAAIEEAIDQIGNAVTFSSFISALESSQWKRDSSNIVLQYLL